MCKSVNQTQPLFRNMTKSDLVVKEMEAGVAVVKIDNPPVNALGDGVAEGLEAAIRSAEADAAVRAIVMMGAGTTFVAGADIKELEDLAWGRGPGAPNIHDLLQRIENCTKPVVMAIHGTALGGGLELAKDYWVSFPDGYRTHQIRLEGGDCSTDSFCYPSV